jgi:hypothetical protein
VKKLELGISGKNRTGRLQAVQQESGHAQSAFSLRAWERKLPTPLERLATFSHVEKPHDGIAVIFDLQGFSKFANQPDVHDFVPRYLNTVIGAVETCIFGGEAYWLKEPEEY